MASFPVNKELIWDYDFSGEDFNSESFKKWYIARVLVRGGSKDISDVGLKVIHDYLLKLILPKQTLEFWLWYFSLPDVEARYGYTGQPAEDISKRV